MGFAMPEDGELVGSDEDVAVFTMLGEAGELFGVEPVLALTRVVGTSMATVAEAATSSFLVNVDFPRRDELGEAHATSPEMTELTGDYIRRLSSALDVILRRHFLVARRIDDLHVSDGFELQYTAVGFADLVNSTGIAEQLELTEVGHMLARFEQIANTIVARNGARTVKLIGDEIMFAAVDAEVVVRIGTEIAEAVGDAVGLPDVRVGIAAGETLLRDGDFFGPIVNLAARLASHAEPRTVLVAGPAAASLGHGFDVACSEAFELAGITEAIDACVVRPVNRGDAD